jgi:peptide/nickel transport system permease protein
MRVADVQLSFPAILIALLIDGVARAVLPRDSHSSVALFVLIFAIGAANWVQYARTVAARRWSRRTRSTSRPRA